MRKQSQIRWSREDRTKVSRTVQQFNSKITRTLKKHPEWAEFLPDRMTVKELTSRIETRKDFNRELNSVSRFMQKGAETPFQSQKGIKTTKWEKREVGYKVAQVNRARTLERKKADVSTEKGTMGTIETNMLLPKKYKIDEIKPRDWDKFVNLLEKQVMDNYNDKQRESYKWNYMTAIINNLGFTGKALELYYLIDSLPADVVYLVYMDDPDLQIGFIYDPKEASEKTDVLLERWKNYV